MLYFGVTFRLVLNERTIRSGSGGVRKWSEGFGNALESTTVELGQDFRRIFPSSIHMNNGIPAHYWEQIKLPKLVGAKEILISPGNSGPRNLRNQIAVIHDLLPISHSKEYDFKYRIMLKYVYNNLMQNARVIATVSERVKSEIVSKFQIDSKKVIVLGAGVEVPNLSYEENSGKYFLLVGGHISRKNADFLTGIWEKIYKQTGFKLVITARREKKQTYQTLNQSVARKVEGIHWIFDCSDEKLSELYKNCIAVVQTSTGEGYGMPLLEGMAHGKPFISTNEGAAKELRVGKSLILELSNELWVQSLCDFPRNTISEFELQRQEAQQHTWVKSASILRFSLREFDDI
jgi:glycosyltransferase involved in cell wall biosynthesis